MSGPKWTNVKYPSGAIMRNAPLLVGVIFSVIIVVGLFFSAESPDEEPQGPLGLVEQLDVDPGGEYSPDRLTSPLRVAARQAAAEAARREREQAQDVRREQAPRSMPLSGRSPLCGLPNGPEMRPRPRRRVCTERRREL